MVHLDASLGAFEICTLLASVLSGAIMVQAILYVSRNMEDPTWLRAMVIIICILDTAHITIIWTFLYSLTVTNYGIIYKLDKIYWPLALCFPLAALINSIIQCYSAYRVYVLSRSLVLPAFALPCGLLRCGFGTAVFAVVMIRRIPTSRDFLTHYRWLVTTPLAINVVLDILNTTMSCFYLLREKRSFVSTNKVISMLVKYTIESGLVTSLLAVAMLCCSLLNYDLVAIGLLGIYPIAHSSFFLASLNIRLSLREIISQIGTSREQIFPRIGEQPYTYTGGYDTSSITPSRDL